MALVDSGADTCLLGPEFHIESQSTDRLIDMQGFSGAESTVKDLPVGVGIAVVDLPDGVVMIRVNEGIVVPYNSILSTNQLQNFGTKVDDCPKMYGGTQTININNGPTLNLHYIGGLSYLPLRKPTKEELDTLPIHDITSGMPWHPRNEENDNDASITMKLTFTTDNDNEYHNNATITKPTADLEHVQRCLGWKPMDVVKRTLEATTQLAQNHVRLPMRMHFKSRFPALNVRRLRETFATDTFFSSDKALGGYTCAQLYVGKSSNFTKVFGMKRPEQMPETLQDFIRQWGAPSGLFSDSAILETSKAIKDILRHYCIKDMQSEPKHQHQNYAERRIQEVKSTANIIMDRVGAPNHTWFLCLKYVVALLNHLASSSLNNKTPIEVAFGVTPDISNLLQFYFYQPVFFLDTNKPSFPASKELFGHWVGLADNVGDALTYLILTPNNQVLAQSTLCPAYHPTHQNLRLAEGEDLEAYRPPPTADACSVPVIQDSQLTNHPFIDPLNIIGYQFVKTHNGFPHKAKVIEALEDGTKYLVALGDGDREEIMTYNDILNLVEAQVSEEEDDHAWSFEAILDHRQKKHGIFEILVLWTTGEETWEPLTWIGSQDPITIAKYAKEHGLLDQAGWKRYKRYVDKDKKFIRMVQQIHAVKSRSEPKIKFGVEVPRNYNDAMRLDRLNNNNLWTKAIKTDMDLNKEYNTYRDQRKNVFPPSGYKKVPVHFVFDVKFDLRRKARLVAGGHLTQPTFNDSPYAGIASIKSIRTCIFLAELNEMDLWVADVGNAYLEAWTKEKLYITAGPEFGPLEGHTLIVDKALYGLRSSGARWAERLADSLRKLGFFLSYADPAIWMKDMGDHYEYICVWVDDMLIASRNPKAIVDELSKEYTLKGVGPPKYYLGADMQRINEPEKVFTMGSGTYIDKCLTIYEQLFGEMPSKKVFTPLDPKDHPEMDTSAFLDKTGMQLYWKLLGMLQWAVTLGRIDIMCATMTLGGFRAQPRQGHLDRLKRVFGFLRKHKKSAIKF